MANLTEIMNPVRWLLDSGLGVDFAFYLQMHTESSVRARSATGQVTRSQGKKTVHERDRDERDHGGVEGLKADHVGRQVGPLGRKIVLDVHNSHIEDKE